MKCTHSNAFVSLVPVIAAALIVTACAVTGSKPAKTTVNFAATDSIPGFSVEMRLPDGWKFVSDDGSDSAGVSYTPGITGDFLWLIGDDGNKIGSIFTSFYGSFLQPDDPDSPKPFSPNYYQCVYPELRLPAVRCWDIDPATSIRTDVGETMLSKIYTKIPEEGTPAASWEEVDTKGIVSYDDTIHVYIGIDFYTNEFDISDETILKIAESLAFVSGK